MAHVPHPPSASGLPPDGLHTPVVCYQEHIKVNTGSFKEQKVSCAKNCCHIARTIPIHLTTKYTESNLIVNHERPTTNLCNSVTGQTAYKYTDMGMFNSTTNFIQLSCLQQQQGVTKHENEQFILIAGCNYILQIIWYNAEDPNLTTSTRVYQTITDSRQELIKMKFQIAIIEYMPRLSDSMRFKTISMGLQRYACHM
jgi:hypothetical protein